METQEALARSGTVTIRDSSGGEVSVTVRDGVLVLPKEFTKKSTRSRKGAKRKATPAVTIRVFKDSPGYGPDAVTQRLVAVLGNNAMAALLGVNKDRPGRWASGTETPTEENRQQLADLDSLVGHLLAAFTPAQAKLWLEGQNPHLNARPLDVYRIDGAAPVIAAIRAHEQGAFA